MATAPLGGRQFNANDWEARDFEWTGKSFYFIPMTNLFGKPIALAGKFEELLREIRRNGYKMKNNIILVQESSFGGSVMIEIEKQDKYDASVKTYDIQTTVDTIVVTGGAGGIGKGSKRLKERVAARRMIAPREVYYWLVDGPAGSGPVVLFGVT